MLLSLGFALLESSNATFASELAGTIDRMQGNAQIFSNDSKKSLSVKSDVFQGDKITKVNDTELLMRMADGGWRMADGAVLTVRPNSNMMVSEYHFNNNHISQDNVFIKLLKGWFSAVTVAIGKKNPKKVKFNTPTSTIGIRGTDF